LPREKALITGINGQDGSYLAELLLAKGYEVHGIVRREAIEDPAHRLVNIRHLLARLRLHVGSVDDHLAVYRTVGEVRPDECYHLAAASFVSHSFDGDASVLSTNFNATHHVLSSVKELAPQCRFYYAGSSEMFGNAERSPQDEHTRFNPRSMYGISKLAGFHLAANYRRQYGLFVCAGILYNHESPRRGHEFVTRKISSTVAKIHLGLADRLELGNIDALRDWGYAPEYVAAMHAMLAHDTPDDYVIATGVLHGVRDFLEAAFSAVGLNYTKYVRTNAAYFRGEEAVPLRGDFTKAARVLGWKPEKGLGDIASEMVHADIALLQGAK
jgi:GDPmannose 4,6-dehydratase